MKRSVGSRRKQGTRLDIEVEGDEYHLSTIVINTSGLFYSSPVGNSTT